MRQATLVFLVRENQILLAMKKRGFGVGRWNGIGGKLKDNEKIEEAAKRETFEEIGVKLCNLNQVAILDFVFVNNHDWDQQVLVYISKKWEGEPVESEEMSPKWFNIDQIPFDGMWPDDKFWLPKILQNKKITAEFVFKEGDEIEKMNIEET